jgi:alpha-1,2-mannosyltransferase
MNGAVGNQGSAASAEQPAQLARALSRLLPVAAIAVAVTTVGATLAVAGDTHGYDFRAYYDAVSRILNGQAPYDQGFEIAGAGGLFFYPPTFIPLALPFGLLSWDVAVWAWTGLALVAFALALVAMPVSPRTRWLVLLVAGLSWPFVHNIKLGQVGPLLLLLFALAWRCRDQPLAFGLASGLGAAIKVQPGLLLVWALLRRRWEAVAAGFLTLLGLAALALLVTGPGAWPDFLALLTRVSDPIATPQNVTPGAVAWQLGATRQVAELIQVATTVVVAAAFIGAAIWLPAEASLMVAVITTQLVSPILWDHYAIILLMPVAWLVDRGHRWALVIPLLTPVFLVGLTPYVVYPLVFGLVLVAVVVEGYRSQSALGRRGSGLAAHA